MELSKAVIAIPDVENVNAYRAWLAQAVFPAARQLRNAGLIDAYAILRYHRLELRFWRAAGLDCEAIAGVLLEHGLDAQLEPYAPAEVGAERDRLIDLLASVTQTAEGLLKGRSAEEVVHWLLNQLGYDHLQEARWHLQQADAHYFIALQEAVTATAEGT